MTYVPRQQLRRSDKREHYKAPALAQRHESWKPATPEEVEKLRALYKRLRFDDAAANPYVIVQDWNYFQWPISMLIKKLEAYEKTAIARAAR